MSDRGVEVWRAGVASASEVAPLLAPEEHQRAARFRRPCDAARAITGRGVLRALLGDRLEVPPRRLRFADGPHGKPALIWPPGPAPAFNVSHSGEVVLVALRDAGRVGVDVEEVSDDLDWRPIAERWFTARERERLGAVPASRRTESFFASWTRKEAWIKATGNGLSDALDAVDTSEDILPGHGWTRTLDLDPGLVGAVAGDGGAPRTVAVRAWPASGAGR